MVFEVAVAAAIAAHLPGKHAGIYVDQKRASYLGSSIVYATGEDREAAAAMIVNLHAESGGLEVYEKCLLPEKGGWGAFGIAWFWEDRFPGSTCGPIDIQASAAFRILRWDRFAPAVAFGHYIGATSVERHPEAKRRAAMQWIVAWEIEHLACL